jgi:mono/diheme cytochrome c family protein
MTNHLRLMSAGGLMCIAAIGAVVSSGGPLDSELLAAAQATSNTYRSVYDGWKWWHVYCYRCHGVDASGTTNAPSLIDPSRKLSSADFQKIVLNGVPDKGMQAWDKLLDRKQVSEIHLYVRARTDNVLPPGRPDEVGPKGGPWVPPAAWPGK